MRNLSKEERTAIAKKQWVTRRKNGNDIPWNKGLKGIQVAWNKGLKGIQVAWNKDKKCHQFTRENNGNWKGDEASYGAFHKRLYEEFGKPEYCEVCKQDDLEKTYHWANLTGKYEDMNDYKRMCVSCHKKYDLARKAIAQKK